MSAVLWVAVIGCTPPAQTTVTSAYDVPSPVRVEVTNAEGVPAEKLRPIFARAAGPLQHCLPGTSGKIILRVTGAERALRVDLDPSVSLDERARQCAVNSLSAVYLSDTASQGGAPGVPPSGFTSLVTVSW